MPNTILFLGGGTGGPTLPLVAIAEKIHEQDNQARLVLVLDHGSVLPKETFPAWLEVVTVRAAKLHRYFTLKNLLLPWRLWQAWREAGCTLKKLQPQILVGAGSYVQVPFIWQAKKHNAKVHIHQQDVTPTLSNYLVRNKADSVSVSFASSQKSFPHSEITGNPTRALEKISSAEAQTKLQLRTGEWILVMGGGSGAVGLNTLLATHLTKLTSLNIGVLHLTGKNSGNLPEDSSLYKKFEFTQNIDLLYSAVSLVVCRSGVSTLAELSLFGLPSVQVPLPQSHQEQNAEYVVRQGAAVVFAQESHDDLAETVSRLLHDKAKLEQMRTCASNLMPRESSAHIANMITKLLHE